MGRVRTTLSGRNPRHPTGGRGRVRSGRPPAGRPRTGERRPGQTGSHR
ncbi:hypothetical protein STRIP9103_01114 [Streptomyces ipomoeae 91-03]|uniref:Uncharacterized protein n=1 Tax=Streptomyces ipomoeae 91-03 TaxID=698759 RepID=L1KXQ8_9ACTN|nr:hypothetical protein STRIP9103_01114 [Streptomyces ipomoeae 91-03]